MHCLQQQLATHPGEEDGATQVYPTEHPLIEQPAPVLHKRSEEETPADLRDHEAGKKHRQVNRLRINESDANDRAAHADPEGYILRIG